MAMRKNARNGCLGATLCVETQHFATFGRESWRHGAGNWAPALGSYSLQALPEEGSTAKMAYAGHR